MNNSTIKRVIILGALAIIGILAIQSYWVLKTWDLKEEEFDRTMHIALLKVADKLAMIDSFPLPSHNLVMQKSSNYFIVNFNNVIDAGILEHYLLQEFQTHAFDIDFEYAIYDCSSEQMVYGNYCNYSNVDLDNLKLGDLPKYDEFTYYFGVKFPSRTSYLLGKMQLSILFTIILLFAVFFFTYSIFVILRQKRLTEMQKDFINNMTHEFKTPISTIKISADVFLDNPEIQKDQRLFRYANLIREQNQRLNGQVEKVLQLARLERNGFKPKLEVIDLHILLLDIIHSNEIKVSEANGKIYGELLASNSIIKADKVHLTNILHNLLDNAIKYCKDQPDICITTEEVNDSLQLSIADKGIGISKEHQHRVFNKFYRVPTGNVHNVKGFGLGLFYIKNIVEAHGWKLRLESEIDKGSVFRIIINQQNFSLKSIFKNWFEIKDTRKSVTNITQNI